MKWYLNYNEGYYNLYFDAFKQQLEGFVRQKHPLVISLEKSGYPKAFDEAEKFKAFFDTKTFRGVGFEFEEGIDFSKEVETYNENKKDVKHTLEWVPESKTTYPAIYVRPEKWQQPSTPENSGKWLKESVSGVSRLTVPKESLKREVKRILAGKSEPRDEDEKEEREKAVEALTGVIDNLTSNDWQIVLKIERVKDEYGVVTKDREPVLLVEKDASIFEGLTAGFALRLCNGFPLSKEQRDEFRKFVEWATEEYTSPCIKAVLRFFLSCPGMDFRKSGIEW